MTIIIKIIESVYYFLWGDWIRLPLPGGSTLTLPLLAVLLVPAGIFFTLRTRFVQLRLLPDMVRSLTEKDGGAKKEKGELSGLQALIASTAARVGMGNLVGVVAAISAGGAGALFWMWLTALLGAARGLLGDAVRTMLVRHAPALGGDCVAWCDALLEGRTIRVRHPAARGVFVHPLDIVCCGLTLGAQAFRCGEGGVYNIGTDERSVSTRQSAARRLAMRHGGAGTAQEETEDGEPPAQLLDGSAARRLCGAACRLDVDQALDLLFEQRRAARAGQEEAAIRRMTRTYLEGCRA